MKIKYQIIIKNIILDSGIPEIGTKPFEPMNIDKVSLTKGQGAVTLAGAFTNLIVHGPSNTTALYTKYVNLKTLKK